MTTLATPKENLLTALKAVLTMLALTAVVAALKWAEIIESFDASMIGAVGGWILCEVYDIKRRLAKAEG